MNIREKIDAFLNESKDSFCVMQGNAVMDIDGKFKDPHRVSPDEIEYFESEAEAVQYMKREFGNTNGLRIIPYREIF